MDIDGSVSKGAMSTFPCSLYIFNLSCIYFLYKFRKRVMLNKLWYSLFFIHQKQPIPNNSIDPWFNYISCFTKLTRLLHNNLDVACDWLLTVQSNLSSCERVPDLITSLVAAVFLHNDRRIANLALDVLAEIASQDSSQVCADRSESLVFWNLFANSEWTKLWFCSWEN